MATIQKRGNSYSIRVSCGYGTDGRQIIKSTTWKPPADLPAREIEKEAQRQGVLFEEKCRTGQVLEGNIRLADFAERWFTDYAETQLRPKTLARYRDFMKRVNAALGHVRLDKLQPHHLMEFYANLAESGIREDTKYTCVIDFKALLASRSTTKAAFAKRAGVSIAVLNSITTGKNITEGSAVRVSDALGLPLKDVFKAVDPDATLSSKTILHYHRLISSILTTAVQWQVIFANPCERVKPPKVERHEAQYLDDKQTAHLLELLDDVDIQNRTIILLLLHTGMRRGELCGLEWRDIDFDNALIHIRRSSQYLPDKGIFEDETKNETSHRVIKAPQDAITLLRSFQVWQMQERLKLGDQWQDCGRIFTAWNGRPIHPDTITNWFHNFIQGTDLPPVSVHSLRHTNATLMIAAGVNLQTVSKRLGHANVNTTGKIYAHAIQSADAAAAETLQDLLHPMKNNTKNQK